MKTKRERFETIASNRVQRILTSLDSLSRCSNTRNYEYSEEDVRKMEKAIKEKLSETLNSFAISLNKEQVMTFNFKTLIKISK